jgi:hypothetical protein
MFATVFPGNAGWDQQTCEGRGDPETPTWMIVISPQLSTTVGFS